MSTTTKVVRKSKIRLHRNVGRVVTDELLNTLIKNAVADGKIDSGHAKGMKALIKVRNRSLVADGLFEGLRRSLYEITGDPDDGVDFGI